MYLSIQGYNCKKLKEEMVVILGVLKMHRKIQLMGDTIKIFIQKHLNV